MSALLAPSGWCTFRVGGRLYGVDLARVQEVLRPMPITPLPLSPPAIAGVVNLRGQIVTAVDLRRLFGGSADAREQHARAHIVVFDGSTPVSLLADAIGDVQYADADAFEPSPETLRGVARSLVPKVVKLEHELLLVLDLDRTLDLAFAAVVGP